MIIKYLTNFLNQYKDNFKVVNMKIIILIFFVWYASAGDSLRKHNYWYTAARKTAESGIPWADYGWNYCDIKCTSFEKYYPAIDFYVINFREAAYKPDFSACYAKSPTGYITLWNEVAKNDFYDRLCGGDK